MTPSSSLNWTTLLDGLRATPARLRDLLNEAAAQGVRLHESDARAVGEIMAHLCAIESPFRARLVRITLQENPSVAAIADNMTGGYDLDTPAAILLDTFSELRAGTVAYLEKLPPAGACASGCPRGHRPNDAARPGGRLAGARRGRDQALDRAACSESLS